MRKRIMFVHTTGSWWDHRYYFKQMPALQEDYADITYLIPEDPTIKDVPFKLITISPKKAKWTRMTGGLNLFFTLFNSKQDAIQLCNIELLPVGVLLGLFSKKKIFYDCREDHYHAMLHSKVWFPKWIRYCLGFGVKTLEFFASKTFTGFIDSDPAIYKFHTAMPAKKKMIFYNMALKSQFNEVHRTLDKKYDFTVLGSMSVRTGVLDVVNAIGEFKKKGIIVSLKLIGSIEIDQTLFKQIQESMETYNTKDQILVTGRIPYFEIPHALADCKVGIIPLLDLPKFQNNIATKQFEYMASEMPVIATNLPPQNIFIQDYFNGLHYRPGDVKGLMKQMSYFLEQPENIKVLGANAKMKTEEEWNSEAQQIKFLEFYKLRMENKPYQEQEIPPFFND
ncbi:glycosyltransferase [Bizionia myxarmorum]|uniref:Glycosyltransferase family 4 protein n=1 Tax=Bizionia myxarmorum TaxID=291186 RepID=A0A5D0RE54_9FLAO|nr:glycosyltransferase [Bizionia myxarmorum]TYB79045.1 glycosyltransferase family 4 protein [Bizionia myxarmorum]